MANQGRPHLHGQQQSKPSALRAFIGHVEPSLQHNGFAYTFIFIYALANILMFLNGTVAGWEMARDAKTTNIALFYVSAIARGGGVLLNFNSILIVLVAARSLMTYLRQTFLNMIVPFDKAMPAFHTIVGNTLAIGTFLHVTFQLVNYIVLGLFRPEMSPLSRTTMAKFIPLFITGVLLVLIIVAMRVSSLVAVRRKKFEVFWYIHAIGFTSYFILLMVHGFHNGKPMTYRYVIVPLAIYILDRGFRYFHDNGTRSVIARSDITLKGDEMVCLRVPRDFSYLAGQYCEVRVPHISKFEWHPFTIASSPHESDMLFFIKKTGDWTTKLYQLASAEKGSAPNYVDVHVRGPYGAPAQHVGQYEHVVLISGGVGATPFASITKYAYRWITTYTARATRNDESVSAAFSRNVSTCNLSGQGPSPSNSRTPSDRVGFSRIVSRGMSRSTSSGSALFRQDAQGSSDSLTRQLSQSKFSPMFSRSGSRGISPSGANASQLHRQSPQTSTDSVALPTSAKSGSPYASFDSVGRVVAEQRALSNPLLQRQQDRPRTPQSRPFALSAPSTPKPSDYVEELGNPEEPIPDRFAENDGLGGDGPSSMTSLSSLEGPSSQNEANNRAMMEVVREYDSSRSLFSDDDDVQVEEEISVGPDELRDLHRRGINRGKALLSNSEDDYPSWGARKSNSHSEAYSNQPFSQYSALDSIRFSEIDLEAGLEAGAIRLEAEILREQNTGSNALDLLGMSYGSAALLRYLQTNGQGVKLGGRVRASMCHYDTAMQSATWQDRLMYYLHTVTVNWLLLWIMLVRLFLIGVANIVTEGNRHVFVNRPFAVVDLVLTVLLLIPVFIAIAVEIGANGLQAYMVENVGNIFEMLVLVPLLIASVVLTSYHLTTTKDTVQVSFEALVYIVWSLTTLLLLWRTGRTIGSRISLAQFFKSTHSQTKSLDFLWVSKSHKDDQWLIEELLPLAGSGIVRLHRFITREGPTTEPWMLDFEKVPLRTTYQRPDWDEVFRTLVERSRSDTVVGVFFCGPDRMARAVQEAAMRAMALSVDNALQRGYVSKRARGPGDSGALVRRNSDELARSKSTPNPKEAASTGMFTRVVSTGKVMMKSFSSRKPGMAGRKDGEDQPNKVADFGCNVRICVRVENFN